MTLQDESEGLELLRRGDLDAALTWILRVYGNEIMSYLLSIERSPTEAEDVFSELCLGLWQALPGFRGECSLRTFLYTLARRQWMRAVHKRKRRAEVATPSSLHERLAEHIRSGTAEYLRTDARDRVARLRAGLEESDRTLLILRLNRKLAWNDIARVMSEDESPSDENLTQRAAALRKRYERLKDQFRRELRGNST
jgi:RNA polymerase sigma-70 factor (ECF subfamily)